MPSQLAGLMEKMRSVEAEIEVELTKRHEDMLRFVAEQFGTASIGLWFGQAFGWVVGIVFLLLLLSAANTAIVAMIGLLYMTARDGEIVFQSGKVKTSLNRAGHVRSVFPTLE